MEIRNLPEDILQSKDYVADRIVIYPYAATTNTFRGRGILHTNTISLVISGEKTMQFASKTLHIRNDEFHFISAGNCLASVDLAGKEVFKSILIFFDNATLADFHDKYPIQKLKDQPRYKIR